MRGPQELISPSATLEILNKRLVLAINFLELRLIVSVASIRILPLAPPSPTAINSISVPCNLIFPLLAVIRMLPFSAFKFRVSCASVTRFLSTPHFTEKLERLVEEFQLKRFLKTKSIKLSGGERRRVEIARSLSSNPRFILLDEPFAGIDPIAVSELKKTLKKLKSLKLGILISDHNVRETMQICDNVLIMSEGKAIAEGTPKEVSANDLVKEVYLGQDF